MTSDILLIALIIVGGLLNAGLILFTAYIGFRMGRLTKDSPDEIRIVHKEMPHKNALDTPDIFSESINDGVIDDPDSRVETI